MESALGWVGQLAEWFAMWIPRWVLVTSPEQAIKFSRGKDAQVLNPGVNWYWPPFTEIDGPFPVVWQPMNVSTLHLMDRDGQPVSARGFVVFRVVDPIKYRVDNHDADECIDDVVGAAIRDVITSKSIKEVQGNSRKTTDNALTGAARKALEDFGVEVKYVRLTTFTTSKMLSVMGDATTPVFEEPEEE